MSDFEHFKGHHEENLLTSPEEETLPTYDYSSFYATMRHSIEICDEQQASDNTRFVENFIDSNANNQILEEEIQQLNNRHTVPLIWTHRRHLASMYYN